MTALVPPTGIRTEIRTERIDIFWTSIINNEIAGYNLYRATESGGGSAGYQLVNTAALINNPITVNEEVIRSSELVDEQGNVQGDPSTSEFLFRVTTTEDVVKFVETQRYIDDGLVTTSTYFYVLTSVNQADEESHYSEEFFSQPLAIPVTVPIPERPRQSIIQDFISSWRTEEPEANLAPGTLIRDTAVEFPAVELEKAYTVLKFVQTQQSFPRLLAFDDEDGDGESDPITTSQQKQRLKQALNLDLDQAVQDVVDSAFDQLAANNNVFRFGNLLANGTALFFTEEFFTVDLSIPAGTRVSAASQGNVVFETQATVTMFSSSKAIYFSAANKRYEIRVPIRAVQAGSKGNVPEGAIRRIVTSLNLPIRMNVTNDARTRNGLDKEANRSLAERGMLAYAASDPGTPPGYRSTMRSITGIQQSTPVGAGDDIMMRDYDPVRREHIGGKVDLYFRGEELFEASEAFELRYIGKSDVTATMDPSGAPSGFLVTVLDTELAPLVPILRVESVFNTTTNIFFDTTNAVITAFNQIILDATLPLNLANVPAPTDVILVTYDLDRIEPYKFVLQPVREISSVTGEFSGSFLETATPTSTAGEPGYKLLRADDPLLLGYSIRASDTLVLFRNDAVDSPSGGFYSFSEDLVLNSTVNTPLSKVGIDEASIQVLSADDFIFVLGVDYSILSGSSFLTNGISTAPKIVRVPSGRISSGESVSVTYLHRENITAVFTNNRLIDIAQEKINDQRHATADVLVKEAKPVLIDVEARVKFTVDPDAGKERVRSRLVSFLASLPAGISVRQSDIVRVIENTEDVEYVQLPLLRMVRADGNQIVREQLEDVWTPVTVVPTSGSFQVFLAPSGVLDFQTDENGGDEFEFRGVFQGSEILTFVSSPAEVSIGPGNTYISDAGDIYVSLLFGTNPSSSSWYGTYIIQGETGTKDILMSGLEFGEANNIGIFEIP